MKKILVFSLVLVVLSLSACGKTDSSESQVVKLTTNTADETIGTKTEKTYKATSTETTTESSSFTYPKITVSETVETTKEISQKTTAQEYQLKIKYKSLSDMNKKVSNYKTLKNVLDSGKISSQKNSSAINSFSESGLGMIFNNKHFYLPNVPKGYKLKKIYLTSSNFFCFIYTDKNKKQCALRIYTSYDNDENTSKFTLSFTDNNGKDIYKNKDGQYCWFDGDNYVILFTGKDKGFINNLTLFQVNINTAPTVKVKKKK